MWAGLPPDSHTTMFPCCVHVIPPGHHGKSNLPTMVALLLLLFRTSKCLFSFFSTSLDLADVCVSCGLLSVGWCCMIGWILSSIPTSSIRLSDVGRPSIPWRGRFVSFMQFVTGHVNVGEPSPFPAIVLETWCLRQSMQNKCRQGSSLGPFTRLRHSRHLVTFSVESRRSCMPSDFTGADTEKQERKLIKQSTLKPSYFSEDSVKDGKHMNLWPVPDK